MGRAVDQPQLFELAESVNDEDFDWAARVSVGLDRLVEDFDLDSELPYEDELYRTYDREVEARLIGELTAARLRDLDEIAFVRFARRPRLNRRGCRACFADQNGVFTVQEYLMNIELIRGMSNRKFL